MIKRIWLKNKKACLRITSPYVCTESFKDCLACMCMYFRPCIFLFDENIFSISCTSSIIGSSALSFLVLSVLSNLCFASFLSAVGYSY